MAQVTAAAPSPSAAPNPLPRPIRRALARIERRLRVVSAVRGLGDLALVAALGAAAGMAADFGWGLPPAARWGVWLAWVTAASATLIAALARVTGRRTRAIDLAALIERGDPSLRERLTAAVGLLGDGAHGSPALIAALADDASAHAGSIDPARAVPSKSALTRLAFGLAAAGLVGGPALVWDDPCGRLARRFLMPWAGIERVGRFVVRVEPGDTVVALGDDLAVSARVVPRFGTTAPDRSAFLEWTDVATGRTRRAAMEPAPASETDRAGSFRAVLPRLAGSVSYCVASRSGESRRFRAEAIAPPSVAAVSARVEPPSYTKFPASVARDASRIEAWEDSRVALTVTPSAPVTSAEVTWPSLNVGWGSAAQPTVLTQSAVLVGCAALTHPTRFAAVSHAGVRMSVSPDGKAASATLTATNSGEYTITLKESHGLTSRPEPPRRLVVRPDTPPAVAVKGADGPEEARGDDTLRVAFAARDDLAVASVDLHYAIERAGTPEDESEGKEEGRVAARPDGLDTPGTRGEVALGLKSLGLKPGDVVIYRVRVADNRPAPRGPNVTWSAPRRLNVAAEAEPLWARQSRAGRETVKASIEALKKAAAETRQQTEQLRYAADAVLRGNGEWDRDRKQALGRREAEARALTESLGALARDLDDDPAFRPLARPARQVADIEAEAARAMLDQARQAENPAGRLADLRLADSRLGAVVNRLDELQRQFNELAGRDDHRKHLQDLADRQAQLADHAEAPGPPDRARLDQLEAEQNGVKKGLDALLQKSPAHKADLLASQADEAEALAKRAREVAARQRDESRQATDLSKKADALRGLAGEQRAIENDARRLALDADTPLVENGRGRLNTDPIRQAAGPLERDAEQSRQHLQAAEAELRRLARDLGDVPGDLKALARRIAARQDRLANETLEAMGESRYKGVLPAEEKRALAKALAPLAARQKVIAGLAAAGLETREAKPDRSPRFPADAARGAAESARRAAETVADPANPREVEARVNDARNAMHRLAGAVPDAWQRVEPSRRAVAEAKQAADAVARDVENHLRETERLLEKEQVRAAAALAGRLDHVAERAREAARKLDAADALTQILPQRDRAGRRARALAQAVETFRAQAPKAAGTDPDRARALRDALRNALVDSLAAFERLEQKLNGQTPADDLADELLDEQRALNAAGPGPDPDRGAEQRRLATALRTLHAPDAPLEQAEAVRLAERAANAVGGKVKAEAARDAAAAAEALAERLAARETPRRRVEALARSERALNDLDPDPAEALRRQRLAAAELAGLPHDAGPGGEPVRKAEEAVRAANDLADRERRPEEAVPGRGKPNLAARRAATGRAAEALDALAATLPGKPSETSKHAAKPDAPRDPDLTLDPALAPKALELARRERRVRERLQALLGERIAPQQEVRREAAALGRELADLRDRARELSPRAAGPAAEAAAHLGEHAPRAMDEAANHLARGNTAPARDAQRRAAELAERGAENADDLAAALRADRAAAPTNTDPDAEHQAVPGALAAAREAMAQATRGLGQAREPGQGQGKNALDSARGAMRNAAEQLQAAAQTQGRGAESLAGNPGKPSSDSQARDPEGGRAGTAAPETLRDLQAMIRTRTGRSWGELPGHLRTEILQMSQGRYRDDYARLIQLYFKEIASGAEERP